MLHGRQGSQLELSGSQVGRREQAAEGEVDGVGGRGGKAAGAGAVANEAKWDVMMGEEGA